MISVTDAANTALTYLKNFYGEVQGAQVEEVEISEDGTEWEITLSFIDNKTLTMVYPPPRGYKTFRIKSDDGRVLSMKMKSF